MKPLRTIHSASAGDLEKFWHLWSYSRDQGQIQNGHELKSACLCLLFCEGNEILQFRLSAKEEMGRGWKRTDQYSWETAPPTRSLCCNVRSVLRLDAGACTTWPSAWPVGTRPLARLVWTRVRHIHLCQLVAALPFISWNARQQCWNTESTHAHTHYTYSSLYTVHTHAKTEIF